MRKLYLMFLLLGSLSVLSGCAVIDFLDGKHLDHTRDDDRPRYGGGYGSATSSGGHSH